MKHLFTSLILFCAFAVTAQLNIDSLGRIDYNVLHGCQLNDIWGYVDENGNEYGLVGATEGTSVVDLTNPSNPTEIFWEPGMSSIWRDLKTWGDYAFVTTEALNGLLIIDLSPLPASTALTTTYYFGPSGSEWQAAHNLYIDSSGYVYIFGANRGNGGVIILDVANLGTPTAPVEVGVFDNWYVHDGYVLNDTMYLAHISDGFMSIVDVTDKSNPVLLGTKTTPSEFAHNIWSTSDNKYAFTTDELPYSYIAAYDVSDPNNIFEVDRIQSSPGTGTIPHNTHVYNDNHIVTSHYSDGVVIHDVTYPYNMVEVGYYDTYPDQTTTYQGCWGAYPFLPSGILLATDRSEGLFVLGPTYVQAGYLEGVITDAATGNPIDLAEIQIIGDEQEGASNASGFYASGMAVAGTYDVYYNKLGYYPQTISVSLTNGVITTQDVQLVAIPPYNLTVNVLEEGTNLPIDNAQLKIVGSQIEHTGSTNALGQEDLIMYYEEDYMVIAGKWGYVTRCSQQYIDNATGAITVYLKKGFYDDFTFDYAWSTTTSASTGNWERGKPNGATIPSAPSVDFDNDCGDQAYVTGNMPFDDGKMDDVDNGTVTLKSPIMDLTGYTDPYVYYARWFFTDFGPLPLDDSLIVFVSNGSILVRIDGAGHDPNGASWIPVSKRLLDYITITPTMQFTFRTRDFQASDNITEAAVDRFQISEGSVLGQDEAELEATISIFPNPTTNEITVVGIANDSDYMIISSTGQIVKSGTVSSNERISLAGLKEGMYFLKMNETVERVIKLND